MLRSIPVALVSLALSGASALAVIGGVEHKGGLSRTSVMVLSSNGGMCSAVVVAPDAALTAAHCASGAAEYRVHYRGEDGEPVMIEPAAREIHPGYDAKAIESRRRSIDLALVLLPAPLPDRFEAATLSGIAPARHTRVRIGGYGVLREGVARTTGTFRITDLKVVEPFGPSTILVWMEGAAAGACLGDSGGPVVQDDSVFAIVTWAKGAGRTNCGRTTQGVLLGPQRAWIDTVLRSWGRTARWQ